MSGSKLVIFRSQNMYISKQIYGNIDLENYTAPRPLRPIVSNNYKRRLLLMVFTTDVAKAAAVEEIWPTCYLTFQVQSRYSTFIRFRNNNSTKITFLPQRVALKIHIPCRRATIKQVSKILRS